VLFGCLQAALFVTIRGNILLFPAFLNDRCQLAAPALVETNLSVSKGEKGVVPAAANISTGVNPSSTLAGDNSARFYGGPSRCFNT
jgi:hypothetical protein